MLILGEKWDDYDAYDPFDGESEDDSELFTEIEKEFGAYAESIIASIICGKTADSAIQSLFE